MQTLFYNAHCQSIYQFHFGNLSGLAKNQPNSWKMSTKINQKYQIFCKIFLIIAHKYLPHKVQQKSHSLEKYVKEKMYFLDYINIIWSDSLIYETEPGVLIKMKWFRNTDSNYQILLRHGSFQWCRAPNSRVS